MGIENDTWHIWGIPTALIGIENDTRQEEVGKRIIAEKTTVLMGIENDTWHIWGIPTALIGIENDTRQEEVGKRVIAEKTTHS